ncbi:MAG: hypothetical protein EA398_15365 [Deltaproteobacteria bacterium]|nr:MAG: hypothetical protein EA398_15365 [Deltaproteobacteria bacterium]
MPAEPQHTVEVAAEQALTFVANVDGHGDLTMAIVGPAGTWCNDDFEGLDPGIADTYAAGTYRIFVGTYSEGNSFPYTFTVRPAPAAPETQTGSLEPGFLPDPFTQESIAGGPRSASEWAPRAVEPHNVQCRGTYPTEPQHVLTLGEFGSLKITASPTTSGDLTMVIEGPGGVWCNDDFEGLDPGFDTAFPAGEYRIFVGNFGGGSPTPYTLSVTEL